jgi:hypothetical protein
MKSDPEIRMSFEKISYKDWQYNTFPNIGVKIELPSGVKSEEYYDGNNWLLSLEFHSVSPQPGTFTDVKYLVVIHVERIPKKKFSENKERYLDSGLYQRESETEKMSSLWYMDQHKETDCSGRTGRYSYYRRDVEINVEEILFIHAEVMNIGSADGIQRDHEATRRIIDSIELIGNGLAGEIF